MFGESDVYRQINNDANGVRPSNVKAPALTWYMAFFAPNQVKFSENNSIIKEKDIDSDYQDVDPEQDVDHVKDRRFFKRRIDQFFIELCRGIRQQEFNDEVDIIPKFDGKYVLFQDFYDETSLSIVKSEQIVHDSEGDVVDIGKVLGSIVSNDYRSVTASFIYKGMQARINCDLYGEYCSFTIVVELEGLKSCKSEPFLQSKFNDLMAAMNSPQEQDMKCLSEFFYRKFWQNFSEYLAARCEMSVVVRTAAFRHIFADFRGVILPIGEDERGGFREKLSSNFDQRPVTSFRSREIWDGFLDFVTNRDEFECTACHMLNNRVLYMSDLAQRRAAVSMDRVPVTFLLCARTENVEGVAERRLTVKKWELGRLIDHIHQLGTVRLAALRDLDHVREASRSLANLAAMMKQASDEERLDRSNNHGKEVDESKSSSMRRARDYFNSIDNDYIEEDSSQQGLQYRVERSRFYVRQFVEKVSTLQIAEIEGYQRYDSFVMSRMGTTFDFINRVGQGHERAGAALSLLEQAYLAENLNNATQKLANLAEKSDNTSKNLENLQEWADLALIGFLIPYYAYVLLHYLAPEVACSVKGFAVVGWFCSFSVGSFRFAGLTKGYTTQKFLAFLVLVGGAILSVTSFLIASEKFGVFVSDPIGWVEAMGKSCREQ